MTVGERAILKQRIATLADLLELREHDLNRVLDQDEAFLRQVLGVLDSGRIGEARALIKARLDQGWSD